MRNIVVLLVLASCMVHAEVPKQGIVAWWRADVGVTATDSGFVTAWASADNVSRIAVAEGAARPSRFMNVINGRPAIRFNGQTAFMQGPELFPTSKDYTLYAVVRQSGLANTNNIISGVWRAFWLNRDVPWVMHSPDPQAPRSDRGIGVGVFAVIRIRYVEASRTVSIAVNNATGANAFAIPPNVDNKILLGSYNFGSFLAGDIAEVLLYDRSLTEQEVQQTDADIHARYAIARVPDPAAPPAIVMQVAPMPLTFIASGDSLRCVGLVVDAAVTSVTMRLDSAGVDVGRWDVPISGPSSRVIELQRAVTAGLHEYRFRVIAYRGQSADTVLDAPGIVCGEVIAISGQSNSIFADPSLVPTEWARTFGSNYGQSASDTTFKRSIASGHGGGANVGGWGLYLQNRIADDMALPTCVINGGVGGTRIEAHFPNPNNRTDLSTLYGSWLYRIQKSSLAKHVRWLFWYQGESNSDGDRYDELFAKLYSAWHEDLPNLERIVVVQIRPGCGGPLHAKLRDDQRKLEEQYPDVYVHAAAGLPAHDGCHYENAGYQTLGEQLYKVYRFNKLQAGPTFKGSAPILGSAMWRDSEKRTVELTYNNVNELQMTPDISVGGEMRSSTDAFWFDDNESRHPTAVRFNNGRIELDVSPGDTPSSISYVPGQFYAGSNVTYQGPWIVRPTGEGAPTFRSYPIGATGVAEAASAPNLTSIVCNQGQMVPIMPGATTAELYSIRGELIAVLKGNGTGVVLPLLMPGVYILRSGGLPRLVMVR